MRVKSGSPFQLLDVVPDVHMRSRDCPRRWFDLHVALHKGLYDLDLLLSQLNRIQLLPPPCGGWPQG